MSGATGGRPSTTTGRRRSAPTSGAPWAGSPASGQGRLTPCVPPGWEPVPYEAGQAARHAVLRLRCVGASLRVARSACSGDHGAAAGGVAVGALWEVRVSRRRLWDSPRPLDVRRRDDGVSGPRLACHRRRSSRHRL